MMVESKMDLLQGFKVDVEKWKDDGNLPEKGNPLWEQKDDIWKGGKPLVFQKLTWLGFGIKNQIHWLFAIMSFSVMFF